MIVLRVPSVDDARKEIRSTEKDMANVNLRRRLNDFNSGPPRRVPGVADECVTFDLSRVNFISAVPGNGNYYTQKGRYLECRVANVDIVVEWIGLNYSKSWSRTTGSGLDRASADQVTQTIVRSVVAVLA
ncbi:hypothetical protein GCM10022254_72040 [Actinomadura meridiana]|uniref:Uncharacterized protein n=1 Tax=Actinomadura meridiana TaxID=559626 RepID=A0ABP8CPH4_9ACTN